MKHLIYLILLLPIVISAQTPQPTLTTVQAFHDTTWEWTDGTNTFQIKLLDCNFMLNEPIDGKGFFLSYKMLSATGNIIYQTRQSIIGYNGSLPLGGILGAGIDSAPYLYGQIDDYSHPNYVYSIQGMLKIIYIPCQGLGCSPQISWKITKPKELVQDPSAPDDYNLPTDIILTKVN